VEQPAAEAVYLHAPDRVERHIPVYGVDHESEPPYSALSSRAPPA
jgi:hypothetical protein